MKQIYYCIMTQALELIPTTLRPADVLLFGRTLYDKNIAPDLVRTYGAAAVANTCATVHAWMDKTFSDLYKGAFSTSSAALQPTVDLESTWASTQAEQHNSYTPIHMPDAEPFSDLQGTIILDGIRRRARAEGPDNRSDRLECLGYLALAAPTAAEREVAKRALAAMRVPAQRRPV